jgi:hypothetical protein
MIPYKLAAVTDQLAGVPPFLDEALRSIAVADWDLHAAGIEFSFRQQLCHLRDVELEGYLVRLTRMAAEDSPLLVDLNGTELAQVRHYELQHPALAVRDFTSLRMTTVAKLRGLSRDEWSRLGRFAPDAPFNVRELADMMLAHDRQHCDEISALVASSAGTP